MSQYISGQNKEKAYSGLEIALYAVAFLGSFLIALTIADTFAGVGVIRELSRLIIYPLIDLAWDPVTGGLFLLVVFFGISLFAAILSIKRQRKLAVIFTSLTILIFLVCVVVAVLLVDFALNPMVW